MAMPDFSFLQNQRGNTAVGDLMQGVVQGAQTTANLQNMKLQQAAQQQQMQLQGAQLRTEQLKYAALEVEQATRNKFLGELKTKIGATTDPAEKLKIGAGVAAEHGVGTEAAQFGAAFNAFRDTQTTNKPPEIQSFKVQDKSGGTREVFGRWVGGSDEDPALAAAGVTNAQGYRMVSAAGDAKASPLDKALDLLGKQGNAIGEKMVLDTFKNIDESAAAATNMQSSIDAFREASKNGGQVLFPKTMEKLIAAGKFVGLDVGADLSNIATANRAQGDIAFAYLAKMMGPDSNRDFGVSLDQAPTLWLDPAARNAVIDTMQRANDRQFAQRREFTKFINQSLKEGGTGIALKDGRVWDDVWGEYMDKHPLATEQNKKVFQNALTKVEEQKAKLPQLVKIKPVGGLRIGEDANGNYWNVDTGEQMKPSAKK